MPSNMNSIVYFHSLTNENYNYMYNICTNIGVNLFDCQKIDHLDFIISNFKPMYLVIDIDNNFDKHIIIEILSKAKQPITFITDNFDVDIKSNNIFMFDSFETLHKLLYNHHKFYSSHMQIQKFDTKKCYSILIEELDKLSFRPKLIGYKYITELIFELYSTTPKSNYKCNNIYSDISKKYNTNSSCIERAIRYSILNAYQNSCIKQEFLKISTTLKVPSIKEIANYILDKIILKINNIA